MGRLDGKVAIISGGSKARELSKRSCLYLKGQRFYLEIFSITKVSKLKAKLLKLGEKLLIAIWM